MDQRERIGDFQEAVRATIEGYLASVWTAMPGIVQSFDAASITAVVQVAIQSKSLNPDGTFQWMSGRPLIKVPVLFPAAGSFALTLPVAAGDEVLVVFASRCIDNWWQNGGVGVQPQFRLHDLGDGFAVLAPRSLPNVLSGISTNSAQLRTKDGSAFIELTADGKVNIQAPGGVHVTGGNITAPDATLAGKLFSTHRHTGVTTGGSDTGGPV